MIINETEKNVLQDYYIREIDDIVCDFNSHPGEGETGDIIENAKRIKKCAEQIIEIEEAYRIDCELEKKSGREEKEDE